MKKKAHFIGICGVGMSAVAKLLKDLDWEISGSDAGFYPPVSDYLKDHDLPMTEGYAASNIPEDVELIVIGKNAKLTEQNEEVKAAFDSGKTVRSFPEVVQGLIEETENIVVAGSYGKSSVTGLLAWCLENAGKDPGYLIGAVPLHMKENAKLGSGPFVIEGDEYPSSNWDDTSKFLYYKPHDVLLTSAEHDHVNVFPTIEDYHAPFEQLLSLVPNDGIVVVSDEPKARKLAENSGKKCITYGISGSHWYAANISYGETTTFDLMHGSKREITLSTTLLGEHNVTNIVGIAAMALEKNLLSPEELRDGVASFKGLRRRLEKKTKFSSVPVYEGFGSSYEKARAEIAAMKTHFPNRRLAVIFEPHTFSWRNRTTLHWYDTAFDGAHSVYVYKPASQGASTHEQLGHYEIVDRIKKTGVEAHAATDKAEALALLEENLSKDDAVLMLTSGDLGGLIEATPKLVERLFS